MPNLEALLPADLHARLVDHFNRTQTYFAQLKTASPEAVILGGGYGRAEGGVSYEATGKAALFNDLDYFIFTPTPNDPGLLSAVKQWERDESEKMGIDVEGKCLPQSDLDAVQDSMMFYDLVAGHIVVMGPEDYLNAYVPKMDAAKIAPIEAIRLLWNRGSGLLFAKSDLAKGASFDLVHRNQSKAKLALGDAWLTLRGEYSSLAADRNLSLHAAKEADPEIVSLHDTGLSFKKSPTKVPELSVLEDTQKILEKLWLKQFMAAESSRLNADFNGPKQYADFYGMLYPETSKFRNLMLGIRDRLKRGGGLYPIWDYPRGSLQRTLVLLLSESDYSERAAQLIDARHNSFHAIVERYRYWWTFYS
jgi:hypothetical protein